LCCAALQAAPTEQAAPPTRLSIADFLQPPKIGAAKISPDGHYLAKLTPENSGRLEILEIQGLTLSAAYRMPPYEFISRFGWANSRQLVWSTAWRPGLFDTATATGDFFLGYADRPHVTKLGTGEYFLHRLPADDHQILVASDGRVSRENLDDFGEKRLADIPYEDSEVLFDHAGRMRLVMGIDETDLVTAIYNDELRRWVEVRRSRPGNGVVEPLSWSDDQQHYYISSNIDAPTSGVYVADPATGTGRLLFRDPLVYFSVALAMPGSGDIAGVLSFAGYPEYHFFDEHGALAKIYAELRIAFPDCAVEITSSSEDGHRAIVAVWSDMRPLEYYLFDVEASLLLKSRPWIDPMQMSPMKPFTLKARDGLELHGYLTLPEGSTGKQLPLVVLPHGGPHGIPDIWGFDEEVQLLAYHGYAVLQLNYRGSGGYGRDFEQLGYARWGTTMQDDLTDATRWAIEQGVADPDRICIYGASYGGYAALMGVIREPDLYRCAIGYSGAYDLTTQRKKSDTADSSMGRAYFDEALGTDPADLKARSPVYNVVRIKVPLLLIHGGHDHRVPIKNFEELTAALDQAGKKYESLVKDDEGHGFYGQSNRIEVYTRLLDFLDRYIGSKRFDPAPASPPPAAKPPPPPAAEAPSVG
jgi:dipeptidyl aminopeptidase/acylaminoacyl peptidase